MLLQLPIGEAANTVRDQAAKTAGLFVGDPGILLGAIVLIVLGILVLAFLKKIIVNSVLGAIAWAVLQYVFGVNLPFAASLVVSIIFGLPGTGVLLLLRFLGII